MAYVFGWDDGERLEMRNVALPRGWRILADPANTDSRWLSMGNQDIPVGGGIPEHLHEKEEEILFFHAGEGEMDVDGETFSIRSGMSVFLPAGVPHGLRNTGDVPLQLFWVFSPPGYEDVFRKMAESSKDHGEFEKLHPHRE